MKVKDIIKSSAQFLNMDNVVSVLEDNVEIEEQTKDELNNFLIAVNMTNNYIASSYINLFDCVELSNNKNVIPYSEISTNDIIEIKRVFDKNGNDIKYKVMPNGLQVDKGNIFIEFSYFPKSLEMDDDITYYTKLNTMVFALGVVAEYLFLKGSLNEAYVWDKKFKTTIFNLTRPKRNIKIPARRWE